MKLFAAWPCPLNSTKDLGLTGPNVEILDHALQISSSLRQDNGYHLIKALPNMKQRDSKKKFFSIKKWRRASHNKVD